MTDSQSNSQEQLDSLLRDGKISQDEYDNLREAMAKPPREQRDSGGATPVKKLQKKWAGRMVGGVCAGIAEHLGVDPVIVRILAIVALLVTWPMVIVLYLALVLILPWDDKDAAAEPRSGKGVWFFSAALGVCFFVQMVLCFWGIPRMLVLYESMGAEVPTLTAWAIGMSDLLATSIFALLGECLFLALLVLLFLVCHNRLLRAVYAISVVGIFLAWDILMAYAMSLPCKYL